MSGAGAVSARAATLVAALAPALARAQEPSGNGASSFRGFLLIGVVVCLAVAVLVLGGRRRTVKKAPSPPASRR